ncbi:MAG: hypothetical protein ACFE8O_05160 [Candidatus Hermodarchaeota archaeon]
MDRKAYQDYLQENGVDKELAGNYVKRLEEFQNFLESDKSNIDALPPGKILKYTESLVEADSEEVLEFLRALIRYANFTKNYDYVIEIIDIAEAYNAMDNLYQRISEQHGEKARDDIFADIKIPPLGVDPETKPPFTKIVMQRLEETLGEDKTIELLAPCLHGRPLEGPKKDREDLLRLGDLDDFLALKHQEFIERVQQHQQDGTLEYAQYVDDDAVEYVKNTLSIAPGIREGNKIISTKIPYQTMKYLKADNDRMKRYYYCHCAWVRDAIKNGEEHEISPNFCHCSAGFTKMYWDVVFDQPITVEPVETVLNGALHCKFAIQIPPEYQKFIK